LNKNFIEILFKSKLKIVKEFGCTLSTMGFLEGKVRGEIEGKVRGEKKEASVKDGSKT
jgi:hypothetical protein